MTDMTEPNYKALALASLKRILDGTLAPTHEPDINGICSLVSYDPCNYDPCNCGTDDFSLENKVLEIVVTTWQKMGLPGCDPLGDYFQEGNLWKGERGERRFELVRKTIDYLENT